VLRGPAYVDATPVPPDVSSEPWDAAAAAWRLDRLRDILPVAVPADAVFGGGASNDVWITGDVVLRVCWRGDRDRFLRDAGVVSALPAAVPHAAVIDSGRTDDLSWMLAERVPGRRLDVVAAQLPRTAARELYAEMAHILRSLHDWTPPAEIRTLLSERPAMVAGELLSVWATDLMPLPVDRALTMIDLARSVPHVDPMLLDATRARIEDLAPFDPFADPAESTSVVHTDATPGNILVHNGKVRALLDFEWVRWGPRDHELVSLVRAGQPADQPGNGPDVPVLRWLEEDYPALFEHPDLDNRLWLSEIVYILHGVIWWPPDQPEATLVPEHHLHTLRRLVEAPWPRR
jgi:aminoglycoside phosphotransferase (APT) family kinase protein